MMCFGFVLQGGSWVSQSGCKRTGTKAIDALTFIPHVCSVSEKLDCCSRMAPALNPKPHSLITLEPYNPLNYVRPCAQDVLEAILSKVRALAHEVRRQARSRGFLGMDINLFPQIQHLSWDVPPL